jgi:hypothetical protein
MAITIPEPAREPLRLLTTLSASDREKFVEALRTAMPRTSLVAFVRGLQPHLKLDEEQLRAIVANLTGMYDVMNKRGYSPEQFAATIVDSMREDNLGVATSGVPEDFQEFLAQALANGRTLGIVGSSVNLILADEKIYESARLTTNLRPVFTSANPSAPEAMLAIHSLTIELHESQEKIVIALDDQDLIDLGEELVRAQQEAASIREFIESAGLAWLER